MLQSDKPTEDVDEWKSFSRNIIVKLFLFRRKSISIST